jgi:PAS domain S-box-containing protein
MSQRAARVEANAEHLRLAIRAARLCIFDHDLRRGALYWSAECRALFGLDPADDVNHERFVSALHPDDRDRVARSMDRAVHEYAGYEIEYRIVRADGEVRWVASYGDCVYDELGRAQRFLGVMLDITAQKRAQGALHESEERFRRFAASVEDAFWVFDTMAGRFLYLSPAYARVHGIEEGATFAHAASSLDRVVAEDRALAEAAHASRRAGQAFDVEYRISTPDGVRWLRERGFAVSEAGEGSGRMLGVTRDVTESRAGQARLAHAAVLLRQLAARHAGAPDLAEDLVQTAAAFERFSGAARGSRAGEEDRSADR